MGPDFVVVDNLVTHKSKLKPDGTKKVPYDYRVQAAAKCETNFRHSHWKQRRKRVMECLASAGNSTFALDRFAQCGSNCIIEMTKNGEKIRLTACYCHSRHCEPCMRAKGNKMAANLRRRLGEEPCGNYRFITLTIKHTRKPLTEQIRHLYTSFKKMRSHVEWKESQWGGAAMLEVKYDEKSGQWHPHLHIISEGNFLHKRDLTRMWKAATGDSFIADIRAMKDSKEVAHYVTKYISKGTSPCVWDIESVAQEWIIASKGVRTMATYGTWRGFKLLEVTDTGDEWKPVTSLIKLYEGIEANEEWAMRLLVRLEEKRLAREKSKPPQMVLFPN
jgi:Replication protein